MIIGTNNKDIFKVVCDGKTRYIDDSIENIYETIKDSAKKWEIRKISVAPTIGQRHEMKAMEDDIDFGSFEWYSTCGGCYTSQFTYMMDDAWHIFTIENINPTDLIEWCIPADKDIYECIGQEEYLLWEHIMSEDAVLPEIVNETYEYLVMNLSE